MLGEELRKARERAGRTLGAAGVRRGVDRSYIRQLENDRRSPTLSLLFRLCDATEASAGRIVGRVEKASGRHM